MMVSNQQFRLKWNNHRNTVLHEFESLLQKNSFVDCTIGADGKYLKAHKIILSACSPYLQNVFNEHFDKHPVILLKDVTFKELKCMIDYMYCGEVNISECDLPSFLRAAQSLKIKGLAEDLSNYDSGSDSEAPETNTSFSETPVNNRLVEANVEIHDDEPPTKKSTPSTISNSTNNSLAGRKRRTPNSVPFPLKSSVNNQIPKNVQNASTNSSKSSELIHDSHVVENSEETSNSSSIDNAASRNENTEGRLRKSVLTTESENQKLRELKEEPIDAEDGDNEDDSSYECGNNQYDDSDALNEDNESNCANSGDKLGGEVSIGNASSLNENDASDDLIVENLKPIDEVLIENPFQHEIQDVTLSTCPSANEFVVEEFGSQIMIKNEDEINSDDIFAKEDSRSSDFNFISSGDNQNFIILTNSIVDGTMSFVDSSTVFPNVKNDQETSALRNYVHGFRKILPAPGSSKNQQDSRDPYYTTTFSKGRCTSQRKTMPKTNERGKNRKMVGLNEQLSTTVNTVHQASSSIVVKPCNVSVIPIDKLMMSSPTTCEMMNVNPRPKSTIISSSQSKTKELLSKYRKIAPLVKDPTEIA